MKCEVKSKELKSAMKAVSSVYGFGEGSVDRFPCILTVVEDGLFFETARMNAYVRKRINVKTLRTGSVSLNLKDLDSLPIKGNVVIDASKNQIRVKCGASSWNLTVDDSAKSEVTENKSDASGVKMLAKMPTILLQNAAKTTTFKSETKDFDVQVTVDVGRLEYCGLDHFSYARFTQNNNEDIKCKKKFHFILGDSLLDKIIGEVTDEFLFIGSNPDNTIVRFKANDLDLIHPTVAAEYQDITNTMKKASSGTKNCTFSVDNSDLKNATQAVAPVAKKGQEADVSFLVKENGVLLTAVDTATQSTARHQLKAKNIQIGNKSGSVTMPIRASYLTEFVKSAPSGEALKVEAWDETFLRISLPVTNGELDYLAMMKSVG